MKKKFFNKKHELYSIYATGRRTLAFGKNHKLQKVAKKKIKSLT